MFELIDALDVMYFVKNRDSIIGEVILNTTLLILIVHHLLHIHKSPDRHVSKYEYYMKRKI